MKSLKSYIKHLLSLFDARKKIDHSRFNKLYTFISLSAEAEECEYVEDISIQIKLHIPSSEIYNLNCYRLVWILRECVKILSMW